MKKRKIIKRVTAAQLKRACREFTFNQSDTRGQKKHQTPVMNYRPASFPCVREIGKV